MMIGDPGADRARARRVRWRKHRDPLLFLLVMLATAALFMTTPYVGYLDNITVLFFLSMILAFFEPGRTSWGARTRAVPPRHRGGVHAPDDVRDLRRVADGGVRAPRAHEPVPPRPRAASELGPSLMSIGFGMIFGLASWLVSPWGVAGSLADAALPPPYTREVFMKRLDGWVELAAAGDHRAARPARDRLDDLASPQGPTSPRTASGRSRRCCLLPFLGTLGWIAGATYPYYRFMNATLALFPLAGLGAYVAIKWLWRREGAAKIAGVARLGADRRLVRLRVGERTRRRPVGRSRQPVDRPADPDRARRGPRDRRGSARGLADRVRRELRRHVPVVRLGEDVHERVADRTAGRRRQAIDDVLRRRRGPPGRPADRADRCRPTTRCPAGFYRELDRAPDRVHGRRRSCSSSGSSTRGR